LKGKIGEILNQHSGVKDVVSVLNSIMSEIYLMSKEDFDEIDEDIFKLYGHIEE